MERMTITLTEDQAERIKAVVAKGDYASHSEVIREALRDWECFDGDTGKDSAREIREYFIPDFSNWKDHDSYQAAFQKLVKDLKS